MRLTDERISKLGFPAAGAAPIDVKDDIITGLTLTLKSGGSRVWSLRYRFNGQQRRFKLGKFPGLGTTQARKAAQVALGAIARGTDPQAARQYQKEIGVPPSQTFHELAFQYVVQRCQGRIRTWEEHARVLGFRIDEDGAPEDIPGGLFERWGNRAVNKITPSDIENAIEEKMRKGEVAAAIKRRAILSAFFGWLVKPQRIIAKSPVTETVPPEVPEARDRVLSDNELVAIWKASEKLEAPFGAFIRLLLLTGQRRNEVAGIRAVELEDDLWTLPAKRVKNSSKHELPLPRQALDEIAKLPCDGEFLVSTTRGRAPISGFSKMKRQLDVHLGKKVKPWTLHDIRRTVATGLAGLSVPPHVTEMVLNHQAGEIKGVAKIYNRFQYLPEKRDALERWANHIDRLLKIDSSGADKEQEAAPA